MKSKLIPLAALAASALGLHSGRAAEVPAKAETLLHGVHRVVFLGDSITQAGDYVTDVECWLQANQLRVEVLNLGLASETAADLTPAENAGHLERYGFGRPFLSERLARVLAATQPDLLFACYGMNDGGSLPPDASGAKRFAEAITHLRETALRAGVKCVVLLTPPVYDARGNTNDQAHDENLTRYTEWLLAQRTNGWSVVDLHTPMRHALEAGRAHDPAFQLAKDGTHPGREGHWLMAREILTQAFGAKLGGMAAAESLFPAHGAEIRGLIHDRMEVLFAAWMTQIGHKRPGVPGGPGAKPGLVLAEAQAKADQLSQQIQNLLNDLATPAKRASADARE